MTPAIILWIYIGLLLVGGFIGFMKAGSKASLIASSIFAGVLSLANTGVLNYRHLIDLLLGLLVVVFAMRYGKTKKFMPAGMMILLTVATLVLRRVV